MSQTQTTNRRETMTGQSTSEERVGTATYRNTASGDTYDLGFTYGPTETPLGRAWDLAKTAAKLNGWNVHDIHVTNAS